MDILLVDDEAPARARLRRLLDSMPEVSVVVECASADEAVARINGESFDLVLLDIRLRGPDGFRVIDRVGPERMPPFAFITAHDEHAVEAFRLDALDYLLKPVTAERLRATVERARRLVGSEPAGGSDASAAGPESAEWLLVRLEGSVRVLRVVEIKLVEAEGNYVHIHYRDERLTTRATLNAMEERLQGSQFVRIHRSALLNPAFIRKMEPAGGGDYTIELDKGLETRLSRTRREAVLEHLGGL